MPLDSPISHPKPGSLGRVALILLLLFGALELFTRFSLFEMSRDLRRFKTYPQRAARLHRAPHLRVAWLGNSAAERGIDSTALQRGFAVAGLPTSTDLFVADASHLNSWKWMANHLFWHPNQAPDALIVPFFNTSLEDDNRMELGRLAQFFTAPSEVTADLRDLPDVSSKLDFLVSRVWATYAERERLKERVLSLSIPNYQGLTEALQAADSPRKIVLRERNYRNLVQFLRAAKQHDCRVIFIDLPLRDTPAVLDPKLPALIRGEGAQLLDLRSVKGLKKSDFADSIHLNPQGRNFISPVLIRALTPMLR